MKNKNLSLKGLILIPLAGMLTDGCSQNDSVNRPNIIFIMSDDHAVRTISAYGEGINHTQNIDRIAMEGALFSHGFCANSISGPSRASILTGKHSHLNGVRGNGSPWDGSQVIFPRLFKESGYETALFGKWHLNTYPGDEFSYYKILTGAGMQGFYYNPEFYSEEKGTETIYGYSTDIITDEALKWLENRNANNIPFLLFVQYKAPHVPRMPALRFLDRYIKETIPEPETFFDDFLTRSYYAREVNFHIKTFRPRPNYGTYDPFSDIYLRRMTIDQLKAYHSFIDPENEQFNDMQKKGLLNVNEMKKYAYQRFIKDYLRIVDGIDENVGKILEWLDQHEKIKSNTIVVYCSDQGYFTGEHGYAEKRLMYEPALRIPLLMRWPETIKPGTEINHMVQNIDFAPTFLDIAGIVIPHEIQGSSFLPLLKGQVPADWRKAIYYHYYEHGFHAVGRHDGVRTERYKLIHFYTDDVFELYDLQNDPHEINNIYGVTEFQDLSEEMKRELIRLRKIYEVPEESFLPPFVL